MLSLRLLRIALEAEALRLNHKAKRIVARAVFGCVALALLLGALVFGHIAAWYWLREVLPERYVALIFLGTDLLLAALLALRAMRSTPGLVEREALALRRSALEDATASLTVSALLLRLLEQLLRSRPER